MFLEVLDLARSGSKEEQIESILAFLLEPHDSGKVCGTASHVVLV